MDTAKLPSLPVIEDEFRGAVLGDARRSSRLIKIAGAIAGSPSASFPKACIEEAALEGAYRFFSNEAVSFEAIMRPHIRCTQHRAAQVVDRPVLVVHDTTEMISPGNASRSGLGPLRKKGGAQGFLAHVALAVTADELRAPLGVAGVQTLVRVGKRKGKRTHRQLRVDPTNEGARWIALVKDVRGNLGPDVKCIHVMDREGDSYSLFSELCRINERFIIRLAHDRALPQTLPGSAAHLRISDALGGLPVLLERTVPLSRRKMAKGPSSRGAHPKRDARMATLEIRAGEVELLRPASVLSPFPKTLKLNLVQVKEISPPEGEKPVEWVLATTEPIADESAVAAVIDAYRARWTIEEFFKALKTGCAAEKRQLESLHALRNSLGVLLPVAWRLLLLRTLARAGATCPATDVLTESQVRVLGARLNRSWNTTPTITEAFEAIARLGGHIRNNGFPGWQVLARGFLDLLILEAGWRAASKRSDQW